MAGPVGEQEADECSDRGKGDGFDDELGVRLARVWLRERCGC